MPVHVTDCLTVLRRQKDACLVHALREEALDQLPALVGPAGAAFVLAAGFKASPGQFVLVPDAKGKPVALFGLAHRVYETLTSVELGPAGYLLAIGRLKPPQILRGKM